MHSWATLFCPSILKERRSYAEKKMQIDRLFAALRYPDGGIGDPLVGIDFIQLPIGMTFNVLPKIPLLGFKGVGLIFLIRGNTAIAGDLQHGSSPLSRMHLARSRRC